MRPHISRRDFLNGVLMAAGGVLLGGVPGLAQSPQADPSLSLDQLVKGGINSDARAAFGGNQPSAFSIGHWMRDARLKFSPGSVTLKPSSIDTAEGTFPIHDDDEKHDVLIVGSGMSGLSAAFFLKKMRPGIRMLSLDANAQLGGNSSADASSDLPFVTSAAAAYGTNPEEDYLQDIYREIGLDWKANTIPGPFYSYFFDEHTPYVLPHTRKWVLDVYGQGLSKMPYPAQAIKDLEAARADLIHWYKTEGSPTDPPDHSDVRYDYLSQMSYKEYIEKHHWHPVVTDFYDKYLVDTLAGPCAHIDAHSAIGTLDSEYFDRWALPGGNWAVAWKMVRWLNGPNAAADNLDNADHPLRIRQGAIVVRLDVGTPNGVHVTYFKDGRFHRTSARAAIVASQGHSAQHIVEHLASDAQLRAWKQVTIAPAVVANVALRRAAPLVQLGLGYDQYWWGGKLWNDFVIADWHGPLRHDPNRQTVLSVYSGNSAPPQDMPGERLKVMFTPFDDYEKALREDLARVLAGTDFDFDKDVSAMHLYRWGHALIYPKVGSIFGAPRGSKRQLAPRHIARQALGPISFAGQDTEGTPSIESAIGSGHRVAHEVMHVLGN